MKLLKALAVMAIASAVFMTGCQNEFTGTSLDTSAVPASVSGNRTNQDPVYISAVAGALVNTKNQEFTITFLSNGNPYNEIDASSLENAVTVRNLSNGTAGDVYTQGTVIADKLLYVSGNVATFSLDCSGASGLIEVFVDSTALTLNAGTKRLDQDGDNIQGEAADDDYYWNLAVGTYGTNAAPTAVAGGVQRNPRAGMGFIVAPAFGIAGTASTLNAYTFTYGRAYGALTDTNDYKAMFDASTILEKYVPASNSWAPMAYTSSYVTTTGVYQAIFSALAEGDVIRARMVNMATVKTLTAYYGFIQKANTNGKISEQILLSPVVQTIGTSAATILSTAQQEATLSPTSSFDSNGLNGKIIVNVTNTALGNKGLDAATVTNSSIRLYTTGREKIVNVETRTYYTDSDKETVVYSNTVVTTLSTSDILYNKIYTFSNPMFTYASGTSVVKQIILNLDPSYKKLTDSIKSVYNTYSDSNGWVFSVDPDGAGPLPTDDYYRNIHEVDYLEYDVDASLVVSSALKGLGDDETVTVNKIPVRSFGNPNNLNTIPDLFGTYIFTSSFKM